MDKYTLYVVIGLLSILALFVPKWLRSRRDDKRFDPSFMCLKASVTIRRQIIAGLDVGNLISDLVEIKEELLNHRVTLQLVSSTEVDPDTGSGKLSERMTVDHWVRLRYYLIPMGFLIPRDFEFNVNFYVPKDFGVPGAILVNNGHKNLVLPFSKLTLATTEFKLVTAKVTMPNAQEIKFCCNSWVYASKSDRVFFSNEIYKAADTPPGLLTLRQNELNELQGVGKENEERKVGERIYDYDVYNDLGEPQYPRPTLGGSAKLPYPRRCRTGRKKNPDGSETRLKRFLEDNYIPRDEDFDEVKKSGFLGVALKAAQHNAVTSAYEHYEEDFISISEVLNLYRDSAPMELIERPGVVNHSQNNMENSSKEKLFGLANQYRNYMENSSKEDKDILSQHLKVIKKVQFAAAVHRRRSPSQLLRQYLGGGGEDESLVWYPKPKNIESDPKAWSTDSEFARQVLAGMNPLVIEALTEFPPNRSTNVTAELIVPQLAGLTIDEALTKKRLFVLNYNERFLSYIDKINKSEISKTYASWTLFFLTEDGTLQPVCIELTRPVPEEVDGLKHRVFRPAEKGATDWEWELAKAHVQANDASWHQVISHWLRTHAVIEPFIIATNRQLSIMHPVHKALHPHFKNTMDINQKARQALINARGLVERNFSPVKHCMEISSKVYSHWRFDEQALPKDLVKREMAYIPLGMGVQQRDSPRVKLVIEDYPYAKDGLDLWYAMESWFRNYINLFYADAKEVQADNELQNWWTEVRTKGHPDVTEGWIMADSKDNLVQIMTTIAWIASCHHAAVNFGQYLYGAFMPNHPNMMRKLIPEEGDKDCALQWDKLSPEQRHKLEHELHEWNTFQDDPEKYLLSMLPNLVQSLVNMSTLEILSSHAENEEYLGERDEDWTNNTEAKIAFRNFSKAVKTIEENIDSRNKDRSLKNRTGLVEVPYQLLHPSSGPGLTNMGIPNSVSI